MILDWGKDNAVIPMTLDGWVWGVFGVTQGVTSTGHAPQAGGKKVSPVDIAQAILYREMTEDVMKNMREGECYRREKLRKQQIENYRIIAERSGKIRQSAALAVLLSEI